MQIIWGGGAPLCLSYTHIVSKNIGNYNRWIRTSTWASQIYKRPDHMSVRSRGAAHTFSPKLPTFWWKARFYQTDTVAGKYSWLCQVGQKNKKTKLSINQNILPHVTGVHVKDSDEIWVLQPCSQTTNHPEPAHRYLQSMMEAAARIWRIPPQFTCYSAVWVTSIPID